jgi:molecular chaperone GrpE (heat shock protein)
MELGSFGQKTQSEITEQTVKELQDQLQAKQKELEEFRAKLEREITKTENRRS